MHGVCCLLFQKVEAYCLHALTAVLLLVMVCRHFVAAGMMLDFSGHRHVHGGGAFAVAKDGEAGGEGHQQE